jgi:hypothetical protein
VNPPSGAPPGRGLRSVAFAPAQKNPRATRPDGGQRTRFRTLESTFTAPSRRRACARRQWRRVPRVPAVPDRKESWRFEIRPGGVRASRSQGRSERSGWRR